MSKFVLAILASSSLTLLGTAALAVDHHMAGEAAAPTHEECTALHTEMMAAHADGSAESRHAAMEAMDAETRTKADQCHAMMQAAHHDQAGDGEHADGHAAAHADNHGDDDAEGNAHTHGEDHAAQPH